MSDATTPIIWTRQRRRLWTGRRDGAPVGTIEQGARYAYVDLDGAPHGGFRTLVDAQTAATGPAPIQTRRRERPGRWLSVVLLVTGAVVIAIGAASVTAALLLS